VLNDARELLLKILSTLNDPSWEKHSSADRRFGTARAQALTLLDQLERMGA
jgi:hypothetical protein